MYAIDSEQVLKLECGDLLDHYAEKPANLEFVKCEYGKGQTIVTAEYRVPGKQSATVEQFLVEKYGIGKLSWMCCGWGSLGEYGRVEHEDITRIDPYYAVIITMSGSGEVNNPNGEGVYLEFDRNKIDYFIVIVEVARV